MQDLWQAIPDSCPAVLVVAAGAMPLSQRCQACLHAVGGVAFPHIWLAEEKLWLMVGSTGARTLPGAAVYVGGDLAGGAC
jgi:hypothetical protein